MEYAKAEKVFSDSKVKRMLVYESRDEEEAVSPENLYSITFFDTSGLKTEYHSINSYQMDTSIWKYEYDKGLLVKETGYFDLYPTEITHEYDQHGILIRSKNGGAEPRDIRYQYDNDHRLSEELGYTAFPEEGDSVQWVLVDSTSFHYDKKGLLSSRQFFYQGNLFSDVHYEVYNDNGQCTKEVEYQEQGKPEFTTEHFYNDQGLKIKSVSVDHYENIKTYHIMAYEFYDN